MKNRYPTVFLGCFVFAFLMITCKVNAVIAKNNSVISLSSFAAFAHVQARASLVGAVTLEWNAVPEASQYIISYSSGENSTYEVLTTVGVDEASRNRSRFSYRHTGLGYGETYFYKVKALTSSGESELSAPIKVTTHAHNKVFNIMPLGDSNTHGTRYSDSRPESERIAYREQLYDLLINAKANFKYVGSEKSGSDFLSNDENAGFPAARTMDILSLLKTSSYNNQTGDLISRGSGPYLDAYNPDIILLHIGTNGGVHGITYNDQAIAEVEGILDEVDAYEARAQKEVTVVLARIINRIPNEQDLNANLYTTYFNDRVTALAEKRINTRSDRIIMVDMEDAAGIVYDYHYKGGDMDDALHPSVSGYQKMANTWFKALEPLLKPVPADTKAPDTEITLKPAEVINSRSATFAFSSSDKQASFQLSLDGAAFTGTTTPVTLDELADGTHTIAVRAVDAAGNIDATPARYTWVVDTKPPAAPVFVAVTEDRGPVPNDQITSDNRIRLSGKAEENAEVRISEASAGVLGTIKANSAGDWMFDYEGITLAEGNYHFTAIARDAAGNESEASKSFDVIIDLTAPGVEINAEANEPVSNPFPIRIKFTEQVYGFDVSDLTVSNGAVGNLTSDDGITYMATVTPAAGAQGVVSIALAAGRVTDLAGNANTASGTVEIALDLKKPQVVLSSDAPELINTPFVVTFTFDKVVTDFDVAKITVANGAADSFDAVSATVYTARIIPEEEGEVLVQVKAGVVQDQASNTNQASNILKRNYDATPPAGYAVRFSTEQVHVENLGQVLVTVSDAEVGAAYFYTITSSKGEEVLTGTATAAQPNFTIPGLGLEKLADGTLTITFYQVDAAGNRGAEVTAETVKTTKDIIAVQNPDLIKVNYRTPFEQIPLPEQLEVTYYNGEKGNLEVKWQRGSYNGMAVGQYRLTGELKLPADVSNLRGIAASVVVEVEANKAPTAISLSASTFKPNATTGDVIGSFTTVDPDDDEHIYALVGGEGDLNNSFFEIVGNELRFNVTADLSDLSTLTFRVRSSDPLQNVVEQSFILNRAVYQPDTELKIVNAFSPDNDGINDTWIVPELRYYNNVSIQIFDRGGVRLFYTTNPEEGWDGRGQNGKVEQGSYFYIIEIEDNGLVQKGVVTVLK